MWSTEHNLIEFRNLGVLNLGEYMSCVESWRL